MEMTQDGYLKVVAGPPLPLNEDGKLVLDVPVVLCGVEVLEELASLRERIAALEARK
jgi:hypothetical protein